MSVLTLLWQQAEKTSRNYWFWLIFIIAPWTLHTSGQIIATSHDRFPPNGGDCKGNLWLFQGNRSVGEILFHLAGILGHPLSKLKSSTVATWYHLDHLWHCCRLSSFAQTYARKDTQKTDRPFPNAAFPAFAMRVLLPLIGLSLFPGLGNKCFLVMVFLGNEIVATRASSGRKDRNISLFQKVNKWYSLDVVFSKSGEKNQLIVNGVLYSI